MENIFEGKTLLVCGNGMSGESLETLKSWGLSVCLISEFAEDINVDLVDSYVKASTLDSDIALEAAIGLAEEGWKFDAVISLCWDCPISVAKIARHFDLPGLDVEKARNATLKDVRTQLLQQGGVLVPRFQVVDVNENVNDKIDSLSFPMVSKPVDLAGCKGVRFIRSRSELDSYVRETFAFTTFSSEKRILIEEYVDGTEYSVEGLVIDGKFFPTALSERVFTDDYLPEFCEIGDILPTVLSESTIKSIHSTCQKSAEALDIESGVLKFDIKISGELIYVFEVTPRLGGPRFGTEIVPLNNGTELLKAMVMQSLGVPVDTSLLTAKKSSGVVAFTVFAKASGIIKAIKGLDNISSIAGFYDYKWWNLKGYGSGDKVKKGERLFYYIVEGRDRKEAMDRAKQLESLVEIQYV